MTTTVQYAKVLAAVAEQLYDNEVGHLARPGDYAALPNYRRFAHETDAMTLLSTIFGVTDDEGQPLIVWRNGEPIAIQQ